MTELCVEQPLASPGSAKHGHSTGVTSNLDSMSLFQIWTSSKRPQKSLKMWHLKKKKKVMQHFNYITNIWNVLLPLVKLKGDWKDMIHNLKFFSKTLSHIKTFLLLAVTDLAQWIGRLVYWNYLRTKRLLISNICFLKILLTGKISLDSKS